jgi:hypothetical protein
MKWDEVSGNWKMQEAPGEFVEIHVSKSVNAKLRLIYLRQASIEGDKTLAAGFTFAWERQKIIRVPMTPTEYGPERTEFRAVIARFPKDDKTCESDDLTTRMLFESGSDEQTSISGQFLLEKMSPAE